MKWRGNAEELINLNYATLNKIHSNLQIKYQNMKMEITKSKSYLRMEGWLRK